jgi:sugar phosphate isomerase/epimerase
MQSESCGSRRAFLWSAAGAVAALAQKRPGSEWQIGCYTRPWDQFDYRAALDGIAEAGYKTAGLMTHKGKPSTVVSVETTPEEAAAIGEEVRTRGLATVSIYAGDFNSAKGMQEGIAGLKRLIDNCAAAHCPELMLGGTGKPELVGPYYKMVAECCDYAVSKGVRLTVKPHGGANSTGPQCRKLIETVGHQNFRVWYDPGNIFHYSNGALDPVEDVPSLDGLIAGMSIKDFQPPEGVMVTPGTGKVNFREVMARAKRGGFTRGPLVVECLYRGEGANLVVEARKARLFLEQLTST